MSNFTPEEKKIILDTADKAIRYGLEFKKPIFLTLDDYAEKLLEIGASFVTLEINNFLRGCIGSLKAYQPLIADIAQNAYSAAFCDPRFPPLTKEEYPKITKHISILSKSVPIEFKDEKDLLTKICPNVDGLTLKDKYCCGTFLPAVWKSLCTPELFLKHLKLKAGLPENYWSDTIQIEKYTVEVIE